MKKILSVSSLLQNMLLVASVCSAAILFLLIPEGSLAGAIATILLVSAFVVGLIQIVIGATEYFFASQSKEKLPRQAIAKKFLRRGILGVVVSFFIFFIINVALSYNSLTIQPLGVHGQSWQ